MRAERLAAFLIVTIVMTMTAAGVIAQTETTAQPPASTMPPSERKLDDQAPSSSGPPAVAQQPASPDQTPTTNEATKPGDAQPAPAAPATPAPNTASAPPAPPPATASVLDKSLILGVLGKDVRSATNENMGRIVDVIVDWSGQTRAAIIDFGGFLGVGSRRIAVDWKALHFAPEDKGNQITLELTRDQVKAAPEYKEGKQVVVLGPSGTTETIQSN